MVQGKLTMITEYHRPDNTEDVIALISRETPPTVALGGGLYLNEVDDTPSLAVVDLQGLALTAIESKGKHLQLGASVTLQSLLDVNLVPQAMENAIKHQETYNRRQVATVAGSLVTVTGRSTVAGVFLALDAELEFVEKNNKVENTRLGEILTLRKEWIKGKLITKIIIPANIQLAYHYIARSPADLPIVAAAVASWTSGRTRVVLMGYGDQPVMVFDGPESSGAEIAARDAYASAEDHWASGAYRTEMAEILTRRSLEQIAANA